MRRKLLIATAAIGGEQLPIEDVALNCYSLILGGDESSRVSAICAIKAFADFPDQWRCVRDGAVTIDTAVEEVLRWATPAMHFARTATADLELGGARIHAGDIVTMWNLSANFDERQFDAPDQFQVRVGQGEIEYGRVIANLERCGYDRALTVDIRDVPDSPFPIDPEVRKLKYLLESLV